MNHPTDRITHTTAFVTPVVEHWLEREIAQCVEPKQTRLKIERYLIRQYNIENVDNIIFFKYITKLIKTKHLIYFCTFNLFCYILKKYNFNKKKMYIVLFCLTKYVLLNLVCFDLV